MLFVRNKPTDASTDATDSGLNPATDSGFGRASADDDRAADRFSRDSEPFERSSDLAQANDFDRADDFAQSDESNRADELTRADEPSQPVAEQSESKQKPGRRRLLGRTHTRAPGDDIYGPPDGTPTKKSKKGRSRKARQEAPKVEARPIRVLMGFLPEVTSRDATEFALGVAEKHFDQPSIAFYDAFPFQGGFVYEVQEGGPGKAFAPEIISHFQALGPFEPGESASVVIPTATRALRVDRTREGLQCVLLPESAEVTEQAWLTPKTKMRPAVSKRTGLLVAGAGIFVTGFFVMLLSLVARVPTYEAAPMATVERIEYHKLPMAQWQRVLQVPQDRYVKALRYQNGAWRVEDAPVPTAEEAQKAASTAEAKAGEAVEAGTSESASAAGAPARAASPATAPTPGSTPNATTTPETQDLSS